MQNKELEEAIKTLKELKENHFIRDKLERDKKCGGLKVGDIYKMTELNPAIETALSYIENSVPKDKYIREKVAKEEVEELLENSIPKQLVEETFEYIEDYFERLNGPDEDIEYIKNKKQELLEEK